MGVSTTTNRVVYSGNGTTTTFAFSYYFFFQTDLLVLKYDTLLGGVTSCVLGVDYTVSGTTTYNGVYTQGASVVFTVAPLSTDVVVIIRNPSEVQNYTLPTNGQISSLAIVQQFDYLTLLIQRLEDQISRAVLLADGTGEAFSGTLPTNIALLPGQFLAVNPAGNGWSLQTTQNSWQSVVIPYTAIQTASTSYVDSFLSVPAGTVLTGVVIKHTQNFAGTGITDVVAKVGTTGDASYFINGFDVYQSVADGVFDSNSDFYLTSFANATPINLTVVSTGANLSALTQGSLTIWYRYENI